MSPIRSSASPWLVRAMPAVFVLIWSTGFIVARYGMPLAPPMKFLALRYALSVLCFVVWIFAARVRWPANAGQFAHLAVTGVLMHAGYLGGVWAAVKAGMGSGLSALIVGLQPVLTAVLLALASHALSWRQWLGLILGFAGLVLVVWAKLGHSVEVNATTLSLAIGALVSMTAGTLYQKRFLTPCDVRSASAVQLAAAFVVTLPLALLESEAMQWQPALYGAMAWSVLGLSLGGSSLLFLLLQRGAATAVTSLLYLVPPCTALMAWLLFGEAITVLTLLGMALTAIGVACVVRPVRPAVASRL